MPDLDLKPDNPVEARRNGMLSHDSDRCQGGAEITTYDSLDASLGQARGNVYIATRFFASFLILKDLFTRMSNYASRRRPMPRPTVAPRPCAQGLTRPRDICPPSCTEEHDGHHPRRGWAWCNCTCAG